VGGVGRIDPIECGNGQRVGTGEQSALSTVNVAAVAAAKVSLASVSSTDGAASAASS
jgi:hypothetical protein